MATPERPDDPDDLPTFTTKIGGSLTAPQRDITEKARRHADAPDNLANPVRTDAPGDPGHASHGNQASATRCLLWAQVLAKSTFNCNSRRQCPG